MAQVVLSARTAPTLRWRVIALAALGVLIVVLIVGASLYRFIGSSVHQFAGDVDDVVQQTAFSFGLFMPLLSYGSFRKGRFLLILSLQGSAVAVWVLILIGAFLPPGGIVPLISLIAVCAYLLGVTGANMFFTFTPSWLVKCMYMGIAVLFTGLSFTIYGANIKDELAVTLVAVGALVGTVMFGVASYLTRNIETASANAAVFGSRLPAVFYFWGGTLYFAVAIFVLPLTLLLDRSYPFDTVPIALYIVLGASLLILAVLVILLKLRRIAVMFFSLLVILNVIVACAASLLTNNTTYFLDSSDRLLPLGIYLIVTFLVVVIFSSPVVVSKSYSVVRNVLSWYAASILGTVLLIISTHSENLIHESFMPLDTFIVFAFLLGMSIQLGALMFMIAGSMRARHSDPKPVVNPNQPQLAEK